MEINRYILFDFLKVLKTKYKNFNILEAVLIFCKLIF